MATVAGGARYREIKKPAYGRALELNCWHYAVVVIDRTVAVLVFPIPIVVVAVFRRSFELVLSDARPVAAEPGIVLQRFPRERIMIVPDTEKAAEAQNRIRIADVPGDGCGAST